MVQRHASMPVRAPVPCAYSFSSCNRVKRSPSLVRAKIVRSLIPELYHFEIFNIGNFSYALMDFYSADRVDYCNYRICILPVPS